MPKQKTSIFYVYVLFDWLGIPRYVGHAKRPARWLEHEQRTDSHNQAKNEFIEHTWIVLGEIPKIKVRENISRTEALETEIVLIKALGRLDLGTGPLTNLTDGGEGVVNRILSQTTLDLMSLRASEREASYSLDMRQFLNQKMSDAIMKLPAEERAARARHAVSHIPKEELINRINGGTTFEDRSRRLKEAFSRMDPKVRRAIARSGGIAAASALTMEEHQQWSQRLIQKWLETSTPEERSDKMRRAWETRRATGSGLNTRNIGSKWIHNGHQRRRLLPGEPLPDGWVYGKPKTLTKLT